MPTACLSVPPPADDRLRLFCFHHAGGAASVFTGWRTVLPPDVEVLPVQLPGRESRRRAAMPPDAATLIAELDAELGEHMRAPYAVYGHSMGGGVAHQLTRRHVARGGDAPVALLVGACPAPHIHSTLQEEREVDDEALASAMQRIGGMSAEVFRHPEWRRAATDLLRADLRVMATDQGAGSFDRGPVGFPLHLFHGADDPLVSEQQMVAWSRHTTADCVLHRVNGGHFFVREPGAAFFRTLAELLSPRPGGGASMTNSHGGTDGRRR